MIFSAALSLLALLQPDNVGATPVAARDSSAVTSTKCNGEKYVYEELAGWGLLANDARDKFGDTIGGIGSAIALDKKSWKKKDGSEGYDGILYGLPDRGWNTEGTQNTQSRIHKFSISLDVVSATLKKPASPNFQITYQDTILLTGPDGTPTTGLDADAKGHLSFDGFPDLPVATYTGDGFGGDGPGGKRIAIDTEGLVLGEDGTFWVSDEYGPYIYQFDKSGKMVTASRPPNALIPIRNGDESFNAASPPVYDPDVKVDPEDPDTGRANNQGLEALTSDPEGKYLYAMLQSATMQEGGKKSSNRRYTRLLKYSINGKALNYEAEYIVPLPLLPTDKPAGQSEMHYISPTQFLILSRDSNAGHGQEDSESIYRNADVFDISKATNIKGKKNDDFDGKVASKKGKLDDDVKPAEYCEWLSYNDNDQLGRFGLHNGGAQDAKLLNEKWESFALAPIGGDEYFLISVSDNDFVTQNGYINSGKNKYADKGGFNIDTQVLVFKVTLPKGSTPL